MRINVYALGLLKDRCAGLVKEKGINYDEESLSSPDRIIKMMNTVFMADKKAEEYVWLVAFDTKMHPIGVFEVSHGAVDYSVLAPREIFVRLCLCGASSFALIHNHPSGDVTPSKEDDKTTAQIKQCADMMRIRMVDHIIIGNGKYYSYASADKS